jgi:BlaI family penicillinase repressor
VTTRNSKPLAWERLGAREREIMEALFARKEATVADVLATLKNPPTYSSVRGMLALLEQKGLVQHRRDGLRYVYAPAVSIATAQGSALKKLVDTFFGGSSARAVATLLDLPHDADDSLTIKELRKAVLKARERGK